MLVQLRSINAYTVWNIHIIGITTITTMSLGKLIRSYQIGMFIMLLFRSLVYHYSTIQSTQSQFHANVSMIITPLPFIPQMEDANSHSSTSYCK